MAGGRGCEVQDAKIPSLDDVKRKLLAGLSPKPYNTQKMSDKSLTCTHPDLPNMSFPRHTI